MFGYLLGGNEMIAQRNDPNDINNSAMLLSWKLFVAGLGQWSDYHSQQRYWFIYQRRAHPLVPFMNCLS
jgi:hypothetical protein